MTARWTDALSVHVPSIDADHRELARIMDELSEAVLTVCTPRVLGRILARVAEFAGDHFSREEHLMRYFRYPDLDEHLEKHELLLARLSQVIYEFELGKQDVTESAVDLLKDWFEQHMTREDAAFGAFLRDRFDGHVNAQAAYGGAHRQGMRVA